MGFINSSSFSASLNMGSPIFEGVWGCQREIKVLQAHLCNLSM